MPAINLRDDPLLWWKQNTYNYPLLSALAAQVLVGQATSVPAERAFSLAGNTVTAKRNRLDPENVNMLMFLNKNYEF